MGLTLENKATLQTATQGESSAIILVFVLSGQEK
jgi:hypothetical protein